MEIILSTEARAARIAHQIDLEQSIEQIINDFEVVQPEIL
jgi:hypothetical protein